MSESFIDLGFGSSNEISINSLDIKGSIPSWLEGTLLRNGPGTFKVGRQRYRHWFDGLAMFHKFSISNGNISYQSKFLESKSYEKAKETGRIAYSEFATDPCRSLFSRVASVFNPEVTDSAKVNIAKVADRFIALAETPIQVEFNPETLKSVGILEWDTSSFGRMTTVHPHFDKSANEAINLVTRYGAVSKYCFRRSKLDTEFGDFSDLTSKVALKPSYIHSFGISQKYLVLVEFPLVVNPLSLLLWLKPYIENFNWEPERGTNFHVFERSTGKHVATHSTDAFFAFHHVNAFDNGSGITIDLVAYEDHQIIEAFYLKRLEDPDLKIPQGRLTRFSIEDVNTVSNIVKTELCKASIELPNFDYGKLNMQGSYRYVYGIGLSGQKRFYDQIVKIDIDLGKSLCWEESNCYPGEPVFVGRPGAVEEDDGVNLSVVLDEERGMSFLLILNSKDFKEIARAELPHSILFGYHGRFERQ